MLMSRSSIVRAAAALLAVLVTAGSVSAGPLLTREEALALAYPGAAIAAERVFLTDAQKKRVAADSGVAPASSLVARYVATKDGKIVGRAYVDTHNVRTKKETLLISLDAEGRVKRVDTTAFLEPLEYQAPPPFTNQFNGKPLTDDLRLQRAIRPIAGATLTARAVTDAVRRALAIDAVLK